MTVIAIGIRFVAGGYHARPWGVFGRDGIPEWPPSPYRLLRALIAAWKYNLPDIGEDAVFSIVRQMASAPPELVLPPASVARAECEARDSGGGGFPRHRMFIKVDKGRTAYMVWRDAVLSGEQEDILESILAHLHYLGRTESWCEVCLSKDPHGEANCIPFNAKAADGDADIVYVLVARSDITMDDLYTTAGGTRRGEGEPLPAKSQYAAYLGSAGRPAQAGSRQCKQKGGTNRLRGPK